MIFTAESPMIVYWLGSLQACGVDLLQYGEIEAALHKLGLTLLEFLYERQ